MGLPGQDGQSAHQDQAQSRGNTGQGQGFPIFSHMILLSSIGYCLLIFSG